MKEAEVREQEEKIALEKKLLAEKQNNWEQQITNQMESLELTVGILYLRGAVTS